MRFAEAQLPVCCRKHICMQSHQTTVDGLETSSRPHVTAAVPHRPIGAIWQGSSFKQTSQKVIYRAISSPHHYCCYSAIALDDAGQSWAAWVGAEWAAKDCIVVYCTSDISRKYRASSRGYMHCWQFLMAVSLVPFSGLADTASLICGCAL